MDFASLIPSTRSRFEELEAEVSDGSLYENPSRARRILQEHTRLKRLLEMWDSHQRVEAELAESRSLLKSNDPAMSALAGEEVERLEKASGQLHHELLVGFLPPEPNEDRDAIVEIRAGTGGSEAALFAADLHRMYQRYGELHGWTFEALDSHPSELGGFKEIVFKVSGAAVFSALRFESGVHRVQRVPATEAQGRIHTSTATVAVLPEAEEVDLEIRPEDLRIEVCRAGGPGGQGVNTTDSAVQVMHLPTGKIVRCQDGRSQQKNRERALGILRARLLQDKQKEEEAKYAAHRKNQIGTGGREEKIRTYNFPQNRITDHRIGLTLYNLDKVMEGELEGLIQALKKAHLEERLAGENPGAGSVAHP